MADSNASKSAQKDLYGIKVGKNKNFTLLFNGKAAVYDSLKDELGLVPGGAEVDGDELLLPLQHIPHVKLTITYKKANNKRGTAKLVCNPEKLASAKASLVKAKYKGQDIISAREPRRRIYV